MNQKQCTKCAKTKAFQDFSRNKRRRDGRQAWCKECMNEKVGQWRQNNPGYQSPSHGDPEKVAASRRRYERTHRAEILEWQREWRRKNPEKVAERRRRYRREQREKAQAHAAVNNAVYRGLIVKPETCSACQEATASTQLHGHHDDYSKPLEVRWLCLGCHKDLHRQTAG